MTGSEWIDRKGKRHRHFAGAKLAERPEAPRLHPQSWHELRQLVKLHGATAVLDAVRVIQKEQNPTERTNE